MIFLQPGLVYCQTFYYSTSDSLFLNLFLKPQPSRPTPLLQGIIKYVFLKHTAVDNPTNLILEFIVYSLITR